jgi:diaminopimelate decarboxylase
VAARLYARAADSLFLDVAGVSVHIGSQITDVAPFSAAMKRVAGLVRRLHSQGLRIRFVDAGGGLGIPYTDSRPENFAASAADYARALTAPLRGLKVRLLLEPGRSIVGPAGLLLTRVLYRKSNNGRNFLIVDAAMNDLLRPALYQAHHEIVPVQRASGGSRRERFDVVGPVCETGDFLGRERELPSLLPGQLLAILDAGAYGVALASNYNTRTRPAEVLVDGASTRLIRRRETLDDILRLENR